MNSYTLGSFHAVTQGRKVGASQQQPSLACLNHRSQSSGLRRPRLERFGSASLRLCTKWMVLLESFLLATLAISLPDGGQEVADTTRSKKPAHFLYALVNVKKTGIS